MFPPVSLSRRTRCVCGLVNQAHPQLLPLAHSHHITLIISGAQLLLYRAFGNIGEFDGTDVHARSDGGFAIIEDHGDEKECASVVQ